MAHKSNAKNPLKRSEEPKWNNHGKGKHEGSAGMTGGDSYKNMPVKRSSDPEPKSDRFGTDSSDF
jgi:hypothetical protein